MQLQEFFYLTAIIVLILFGLALIANLVLLFYIKRLADKTALQAQLKIESLSDVFGGAARTWRNLTVTRFIIRAFKFII